MTNGEHDNHICDTLILNLRGKSTLIRKYQHITNSSSRVVVERYDRLELRTKDSNVTVVELSLFNYGGGPGQRGPGPCIARKVQKESGPE